jgi:hypothetical protein
MTKKNLKSAGIDSELRAALTTAPDFTQAFSHEVQSLRDLVAEALSAKIEHDDDMNYSSAQKLVVWLNGDYQPVAPHDSQAACRLIVFVSSRGRFFSFVTLTLSASTTGWKKKGLEEPRRNWTVLAADTVPDEIKNLQKKITFHLESNRFSLLESSVLSQAAKGHQTKLDGRPATVFDVLFSEII